MASEARGSRPYPTPGRDTGGREPADAGAAGAGRAACDTGAGSVALLALLTSRQQQCLALVCWGFTAEAIGRSIGISPWSVKGHLTNTYRRLGVYDRNGAAMLVLREGGR
jgi:DNA-binding NarL/FixJ family response regulator